MPTTALATPPSSPPSPSAGLSVGSERRATLLVTRLNRAVQRASIYPVGHPAVAVGIGPFFEALHPLLVDGPVTMALGRTKVLVATATAPPAELEPMWFTARLFDRGVST
ncbi:MAG: hypothetical protein AB7G23_17045 [Vicinamibacterales bacterium]